MKVNAQVRVVKTEHSTEVFVTSENPYINFNFHLPPSAEIKSGDGLEFAHAVPAAPAKADKPAV